MNVSLIKVCLINWIYLAVCALRLPVVVWRRVRHGRSFGNPAQRLFGLVPGVATSGEPVIWLHAVSVGEVHQLGIVLDELRRRCPEARPVVSTTTATGMQLLRKKHPELTTFWFPIDFGWAVRTALKRIRPALLVLTELELWPNLLWRASRENIPVAVINGRLSERSFRGFRRVPRFSRSMFSCLSIVVAQNEEYARRFVKLGVPVSGVHVAGSLKFDHAVRQARAVEADAATCRKLRERIRLADDDCLLVAGSTQQEDEQLVVAVYRALRERYPRMRLVIVPRHPHRASEVVTRLAAHGIGSMRSSGADPWPVAEPGQPQPVAVVDTIGELCHWWSLARVAFVGGTMGHRGGQNMLEPAVFGCATCFGPNTWNFGEIVEAMLRAEAAEAVRDEDELATFIARCLDEPAFAAQLGDRARDFVFQHQGAAAETVERLIERIATSGETQDATRPRAAA